MMLIDQRSDGVQEFWRLARDAAIKRNASGGMNQRRVLLQIVRIGAQPLPLMWVRAGIISIDESIYRVGRRRRGVSAHGLQLRAETGDRSGGFLLRCWRRWWRLGIDGPPLIDRRGFGRLFASRTRGRLAAIIFARGHLAVTSALVGFL